MEVTRFLMSSCSEDLSSKKRYKEAGQVLLDYCSDIRESVIALTSGNMFSEARRIVGLFLPYVLNSLR